MIKLIASDMDGTLLPYMGAHVDPEVFEIIKKLKAHGIQFMAASGRQHANLMKEFEPVKQDIDYMCENGCLVFHNGRLLFKETMPDDVARELIQTILDTPGYKCLVSGEETSYILKGDPAFSRLLREEVHNVVTEVDDLLHVPEAYFKISGYRYDKNERETLQQIDRYWTGLFEDRLTTVYGGNCWVDFSPIGVTKGTSITRLMSILHLKKDEVMAFGDNYNDEEMLNDVGYSFAMERAPQEIRDFTYGTTNSVKETLKEFFHDLLS